MHSTQIRMLFAMLAALAVTIAMPSVAFRAGVVPVGQVSISTALSRTNRCAADVGFASSFLNCCRWIASPDRSLRAAIRKLTVKVVQDLR